MKACKKPVYPKALKKGAHVAFIVPAWTCEEKELACVQKIWEERGYTVEFAPSCYRQGVYGGTPREQAEEFNHYMTHPKYDAVISMRGGYGTMRYLEHIDYQAVRKAKKLFVGYSDTTALQNALYRHSGLVTYHGPMAVDQVKTLQIEEADRASYQEDLAYFWDVLEGRRHENSFASIHEGIVPKDALYRGRVFGGNLTLVVNTLGTPFGLDAKAMTGNFLFLEDLGERTYQIDRMLEQLRLSGILKAVQGILLGSFHDCTEQEDTKHRSAYEDLATRIQELLVSSRKESSPYWAQIPVIENPFVIGVQTGHYTPHRTLPLGGEITIDFSKGCIRY